MSNNTYFSQQLYYIFLYYTKILHFVRTYRSILSRSHLFISLTTQERKGVLLRKREMMLRRIPRSMLMPVSNLSQFSSLVTTTPKILNDKNDFQGIKTRKYQTTRPLLLSSQDDSSLSYSERQGTYFSVTINSLFHTETFVFTCTSTHCQIANST